MPWVVCIKVTHAVYVPLYPHINIPIIVTQNSDGALVAMSFPCLINAVYRLWNDCYDLKWYVQV